MPFDLFLSRGPNFANLRAGDPIAPSEIDAVMQEAPAVRRDETTYWVRHRDGSPWFALRRDEGVVVLSASYMSHRFLRNAFDMFDLGLALGAPLRARLFEEVGGREVTAQTVDALLDPQGAYVAHQVATFRHAIERMHSEALAPLEYPVGAVDAVRERMVLFARLARAADVASVRAAALRALPEAAADGAPDAFAVQLEGKDVVKVLRRDDCTWQVWPAHGAAPFAVVAPATLAVVESIAAAFGGDVEVAGRPYASLRDELHTRSRGLCMELQEWLATFG